MILFREIGRVGCKGKSLLSSLLELRVALYGCLDKLNLGRRARVAAVFRVKIGARATVVWSGLSGPDLASILLLTLFSLRFSSLSFGLLWQGVDVQDSSGHNAEHDVVE